MIRTRTLIALVCSVTVLGLYACKSSHEQATQHYEKSDGKQAARSEESEAHEGLPTTKPATSLTSAIATAQMSVPDGRFVVAKIDNEGGKTTCIIGLACGDALRKINIDPATGAILASENEKLDQQSRELLERIDKDPKLAPIGAGQAIDAAMAKVPGSWACFAILGTDDEKVTLFYVVMLVAGKQAKFATVAAADGTVQTISDLELEEEDEGRGDHEAHEAKPK